MQPNTPDVLPPSGPRALTGPVRAPAEALCQSEELNRRILEAVPGGVVTVAADGTILQANAEALCVLGLTWDAQLQEYVGQYELETVWEDGSLCALADYPVTRCLQSGEPQPAVTLGVRRPGGRLTWVVCTAVPVPAGDDRAAAAVATFLDVTSRKEAEGRLRESEERHRLIADLTSDYAYTCTVDEAGEAHMESVTDGFYRVTGYTVGEVEAMGWERFIHPRDFAGARRRMAGVLAGRPDAYELRIVTRGRRVRWVRYLMHPVWDEARGRVVRLLGAVQDITGRKRAERKLREYAARLQTLSHRLLEVQEQERRHLARELHDEIGQALTGLKLALEMSARLPPAEVLASLDEAQRQLRELTGRVRDLSFLLRPTMLDDLGLLPALLWLVERHAAKTGLRVDFEHAGLERRLPPGVETAAYRIAQEALTNVVRHARTREARLRVWLDGGLVRVQVEDRGVGFDYEAALAAGASNGLSGMHERAGLLGGRVALETRPGAGTRLTAELPARCNEEGRPDDVDAVAGR
jgi:PAS domain S-box-containing protein